MYLYNIGVVLRRHGYFLNEQNPGRTYSSSAFVEVKNCSGNETRLDQCNVTFNSTTPRNSSCYYVGVSCLPSDNSVLPGKALVSNYGN